MRDVHADHQRNWWCPQGFLVVVGRLPSSPSVNTGLVCAGAVVGVKERERRS